MTSIVSAISPTPTNGSRAAHQGGILEGANPAHYDSKNPIIVFIIQVGFPSLSAHLKAQANPISATGWHHHRLLPPPSVSPLQDPSAHRHRRDHWRHSPGSFGPRPNPRLLRCHLPQGIHPHPLSRRQPRSCAFPVPRRTRGRLTSVVEELEDLTERRRRRHGPSFWPWVRRSIWIIS